MIQRLDTLRRLLEAQTVECICGIRVETMQGWRTIAEVGAPDTCPQCHGIGRVPDPRWAAMLALTRDFELPLLEYHGGSWLMPAVQFWSIAPKGALAGAILSAWPLFGEHPALPGLLEAVTWVYWKDEPDQAAVTWAIARLKAGQK